MAGSRRGIRLLILDRKQTETKDSSQQRAYRHVNQTEFQETDRSWEATSHTSNSGRHSGRSLANTLTSGKWAKQGRAGQRREDRRGINADWSQVYDRSRLTIAHSTAQSKQGKAHNHKQHWQIKLQLYYIQQQPAVSTRFTSPSRGHDKSSTSRSNIASLTANSNAVNAFKSNLHFLSIRKSPCKPGFDCIST